MMGQSWKIRTRWNSATKVKIIPATIANVLWVMGRSTGKASKPGPSPSLRFFMASARNPFANAVSDGEANDQTDYNFHGEGLLTRRIGNPFSLGNPFEASINRSMPPQLFI
jgi:hypothetical protein